MKKKSSDRGSAMVEMALLVGCVALCVFAAGRVLGNKAYASFQMTSRHLDGLNSTLPDDKLQDFDLPGTNQSSDDTQLSNDEKFVLELIKNAHKMPSIAEKLCTNIRKDLTVRRKVLDLSQGRGYVRDFVEKCVRRPQIIPGVNG